MVAICRFAWKGDFPISEITKLPYVESIALPFDRCTSKRREVGMEQKTEFGTREWPVSRQRLSRGCRDTSEKWPPCAQSKQRARCVLYEQIAVAHVAGQHGVRGMAGLLPYLPAWHPGLCRAGGQTGSEAMP